MKNMKINILMMALVGVALVSCQKDDVTMDDGNFPTDGVIRVTTEVAQTRAGVTTDNLTEFSFFVFNDNNDYTYKNIKMTKSGSDWLPASQMLWQNATTPVMLLAYAPYDESIEEELVAKVLADQSTTDNVKESDFIYMFNPMFVPKEDLVDGKVKISLDHLMSKLEFKITLGTAFNSGGIPAANPISNIIVDGTILSGTVNPGNFNASPYIEVSSDNPATITPFMAGYTLATDINVHSVGSYEVILVPQTIATGKFEVAFKIDGKDNRWKAKKDIVINGGKKYALELTVGKDIVTAGTMSATEWTEGTGGSVETE